MKKSLVIICVVVGLVIVYFLATSGAVRNALKGTNTPSNNEDVVGKTDGMPSATDSGTFTVDKKLSKVSLSYSSKTRSDSWDIPIKSGDIVLQKGSITGGTIVASSANLGKTGLAFNGKEDSTISIKSIVFDQARSTTDNLVFRTDTELTMNGKTAPVSFESRFNFEAGNISIVGSAMPDWKQWGVVVPTGESMALNISLNATNK